MEKTNAVILAGGLARRLNGVQKGLQHWAGKPLISHIVDRLAPQAGKIFLNITRLPEQYAAHYPDLPTFGDAIPDFQGPLSGMLAGLQNVAGENVLFVPCDSPLLPENLLAKLQTALRINAADIAYAHDGERAHPTFALISPQVAPALAVYLARGERRILYFFQQQKSVAVDFSEQKAAFRNFNTPEDFASNEAGNFSENFPRPSLPLLGITGRSGTGKTTLLERLIPVLVERGIRVGLIKHSHHNVDVDKAGKDSHRLRLAGANPTMIASEKRWALMCETPNSPASFAQLVAEFADKKVDLVLVEGFKHEPIPKIQLHRQAVGDLPELDEFTLATATDYLCARENALDLNNVQQIAEFIERWLKMQN